MSPKNMDYEVPKGFKMVEQPIDGNNTVRRYLVPVETTEDDISENARLLDQRETDGILARSARPEVIVVGDKVRRRPSQDTPDIDTALIGTVHEKLRTGKFRVKWDDGTILRHENTELLKVW